MSSTDISPGDSGGSTWQCQRRYLVTPMRIPGNAMAILPGKIPCLDSCFDSAREREILTGITPGVHSAARTDTFLGVAMEIVCHPQAMSLSLPGDGVGEYPRQRNL